MKKRYVICLAAAALLSGCGSEGAHTHADYASLSGLIVGSVTDSDTSADSSDVIGSSGSAEETHEDVSSGEDIFSDTLSYGQAAEATNAFLESEPEQNTDYGSDIEQDTDYGNSDAREYVLIRNPRNSRVLKIDKDTLTISGNEGLNGFDSIAVDTDYANRLSCDVSDGEFSCTVGRADFSNGYHSIKVIDGNGKYESYRIFVGEDGFSLPLSPDVEENNREIFSAPKPLSDEETARYITIDGSMEKCPEILERIKEISDEICGGIDSDYDKLCAISQWVSYEIYYDYPAHDNGMPDECLTLEYMLENHTSVCGGYSNMTSALCAAQGIECYNVKGRAVNNGYCFSEPKEDAYHEWNYAVIDGRGVIVDSGWDSASYYYGDKYKRSSVIYRWFDVDPAVFSMDHKAVSMEYRDYNAVLEGDYDKR